MLDGLFLTPVMVFAFYIYLFPMFREFFHEFVASLEHPETVPPPEPPVSMFTILPFGYYAIIGGSLVLYQFLSYYLAGASPGKLLLSITVVDENGDSVKGNPLTSLRRAGTELVTMTPVVGQLTGLLNVVLVLVPDNRSIFDRAASTKVIRRSS